MSHQVRIRHYFWIILSVPAVAFSEVSRPPVKNDIFEAGEKFIFRIKYEFMEAGQATLEVENGPATNGYPTYQLISRAKSTGFIDKIYKVRDLNLSIIEQHSLASLGLFQDLKEGRFVIKRDTKIDYSSGTWSYERTYKGKTTFIQGTIEKPVSDILSSFYMARTLPLELGQTYFIEIFAEKKVYPLRVEIGPKVVSIKVPAGRFDCIRVQPFMIGEGLFNAKDDNLVIYMTNNQKKMPILLSSKVFIGSFDAELISYRFNDQMDFQGGSSSR